MIGNFAFIVSEAPDHGLQVREEKMHNLVSMLDYIEKIKYNFNVFQKPKKKTLQIFDLTTLRSSTGFQILEATAEWLEFGNAHNIVANEETGHVFVVGAVPTIQTIPGITCAG